MIRGYIRYRRTMLCATVAALGVFPAVMLLCSVPLNIVLYSAAIYLFIIFGFVGFDLFRYSAKVKRLAEIESNITRTIHEYPESENNIEKLYSGIIASIYRLMDEERRDLTAAYGEQVDYYTMWLHQIKTPISAMRLAIENDEHKNPVYEQELFKIERYVEMALQYVKLRNIENDLRLETYDLDEIILECIKKYSTPFIYKNLSVDFKRTKLRVITDKKWLSFIIEQLLSNAVKYTMTGGLKIYKSGYGFTIEDSGIGIRSEDLARIFEKGYTGYNGRLDGRASGLGLYMANNIAKCLSLSLSVSSKVSKGTKMTISFSENEN